VGMEVLMKEDIPEKVNLIEVVQMNCFLTNEQITKDLLCHVKKCAFYKNYKIK
jgi:hypothetical protein